MNYTAINMKTKTKSQFSIGTDPEFMLFNKGRKQIVSAIPVVENNKYDPVDLGGGCRFYHDNVNLEFTVPPSNSPEELVGTMRDLFKRVKDKLPEFSLSTQASHTFNEDECEHPDAKEFGCNPELDVYLQDQVQPPESGHTFRSAGGHIHLGNNNFNAKRKQDRTGFLLSFEDKEQAIKLMDIFVGLSLVVVDNDPSSGARKKLYGKAGRFRVTPYGVEYRTPSPYWLTSPKLTELTANLTFFTLGLGQAGKGTEIIEKMNMEKVAEAINENNKDLALDLLQNSGISEELLDQVKELSAIRFEQTIDANWDV